MKLHKILYFDIETNAIDHWPTLGGLETLHCISVYDPVTSKMHSFSSNANNLDEGVALLNNAHNICGHNAINFDAPALKKLGYDLTARVVDTKVMSACIHPDLFTEDCKRTDDFPKNLRGSHGLKAWGLRLGNEKDDHGASEDWSTWSQEMQDYCDQDVMVVYDLFLHFLEGKPSQDMLGLEHDFAVLMTDQETNGWPFDTKRANSLTEELMARRAELRDELQDMFPSSTEEMKTPSGWTVEVDGKQYTAATKSGLKLVLKENKLKQVLADKATKLSNKTKTIPFNPNSRDQIAERLIKMGWEPQAYEGKRPKIDESTLKSIGTPEADMLLEYLLISKRLGQVAEGQQAWLKLVKDGRIHGSINTNGAISGRCTHSKPNVAQVPSDRSPYGAQCRELFRAPKGKVLVGADASGLELRLLAHYLSRYDKGAYAKVILEGDVHTANQLAAGLPDRASAKTFIYAWLYGAGDAKIGSIVGGKSADGKKLKASFMQKYPAIKMLTKAIEKALTHQSWLGGLDGRRLPCRSPHSALNLLLQSAGAVVMKKALVRFSESPPHPYELHGNIHDEVQFSCLPEHAEELGQHFCQMLTEAGRSLKLGCRLDGEYSVGESWKETH